MTGDNWVSDEDFALIELAKQSIANGGAPASVDDQLTRLREAGDEEGYTKAYERAIQAAIKAGDNAEVVRLSEQMRPFGATPKEAPEPGPSESEVAGLHEIFNDPEYVKAMKGTKADPVKMNAVYEQFGVPKHARLVPDSILHGYGQ
jgi:hypothetical protein